MRIVTTILSSCVLLTACSTHAGLAKPSALAMPALCATAQQTALISDYVTNKRPGVPLAIPSRNLKIPEGLIASGLPDGSAVGVSVTPELTKKIWASIDAWGKNTTVSLIFSPSSQHAFAFSSLVPVAQIDEGDGYLDVYADDGDGVHSHLQLDYVSSIWATDLQTVDGASRSRGISLFGPDDHLIVGVYASVKGDPFDEAAVNGFAKTWDLIASMPQACS
ncbi:MAG: hypothetical protein COA69_03315 [Robiginitomaculum sp.]|nr:MAG: hypothetical protein COA69_03315 [Robiginitomaculum sp.]